MAMPQAMLLAKIREIQSDTTLSDAEKAKKRQELMSGKWAAKQSSEEENKEPNKEESDATKLGKGGSGSIFDETLQCAFCCNLCERPVTAPCQHNFCLKCFQKWVGTGKKTCPTCRHNFPASFASNPRINTALTVAIRMAKLGEERANVPPKPYTRVDDKERPDEAFVTERAVRAGRANAASGRIMVNVPNDHFGPIPAEADPRGLGIRVGEWWKDRLDCRQWGAHFPHVAGIAGQSNAGAQSVVLSGGYEDDRDEGEWFLYTGSGGRDLSGNKRTNKVQSFDQKFESMNAALKVSCVKGLPVRVVRSFKEKRSSYAPSVETPVRYDGIYRIAKCWRKPGAQGFLICRYLFVRCDNEPAPWSSEEAGDKPDMELPAEALAELSQAKGPVFEMGKDPWWGWKEAEGTWGWTRAPPVSQRTGGGGGGEGKKRNKVSEAQKALQEFVCKLCKVIISNPIATPCGHNFCKACVDARFAGMGDEQEVASGRSLRVRKVIKPCPTCKTDIGDFLRTAQVNREMAAVIAKLQETIETQRAAEKAAKDGQDEDAHEDQEGKDQEEQAEEEIDTPAADVPAPAAAPPAPAAAPAAPPASNEAKAAALAEEFPSFDAGLIASLLEDQGGDELEVRFYLKDLRFTQRMHNQLQAASRKKSPKKQGTKRSAEGEDVEESPKKARVDPAA